MKSLYHICCCLAVSLPDAGVHEVDSSGRIRKICFTTISLGWWRVVCRPSDTGLTPHPATRGRHGNQKTAVKQSVFVHIAHTPLMRPQVWRITPLLLLAYFIHHSLTAIPLLRPYFQIPRGSRIRGRPLFLP